MDGIRSYVYGATVCLVPFALGRPRQGRPFGPRHQTVEERHSVAAVVGAYLDLYKRLPELGRARR